MNDIINENDFDEFEQFQIKYEELTQLCTDEELMILIVHITI